MSAGVALLLVLASAVGCKKDDAPEAPKCRPVVDGLVARLHPDGRGGPELEETRSNYKAVLSNRCSEDKWSAEALACIQVAPNEGEFQKCQYKNLSQEQQDKLSRATKSIALEPKASTRSDPKQGGGVAEAMAAMTGFADKMCNCNDKACADGVQDEMNTWSAAMAKTERGQNRPDEATMKRMQDVGERYGECMAKAMSGGGAAPSRSSSIEAPLQLNKLGKNAKVEFYTNASFPVGRVPLTPARPCCSQPGQRCAQSASNWANPIWQSLDFQIDEPSIFQYSYESDGNTLTALAVGDPTCSGRSVTFTLKGTAPGGNVTMTLLEPGK